MHTPHSGFFDEIATELFFELISKYNYVLSEKRSSPLSVKHIYLNTSINRRIEISNETHGYDYGFSFFIYNILSAEYNILYNVPNEHQDPDCKFLIKVQNDLFTTKDTLDLIAGHDWKQHKHIIFQL